MKSAKLDTNVYALVLEPGDDIHTSIESFCAHNDLANAQISGIGSIENPKLAHYTIATREFTDKQLAGIFEVVSLQGNVALVDGKQFAHLHVTVSDAHMTAFAGHLVQAACSATLEVIITAYNSRKTKSANDAIGLKVWDFDQR